MGQIRKLRVHVGKLQGIIATKVIELRRLNVQVNKLIGERDKARKELEELREETT